MDELWNIQKKFLDKIIESRDEDREETAARYVLHIFEEIAELLDALGGAWKTNVRTPEDVRRSQILIESVDVIKLAMSIPMLYGYKFEDFKKTFIQKSKLINLKYEEENRLKEMYDEPKVVLDLDGVLMKYPELWLDFLNKHLKKNFRVEDLTSPYLLWQQLEIPPETYEYLKRMYRDSGEVLKGEPIEGSQQFVFKLHQKYKVVILTRRPVDQYERLAHDTIEWLDKHNYHYDAILFSQEKPYTLKTKLGNVVFCLEDDPREAENFERIGYKSLLLKRPYNNGTITFEKILETYL